MAKPSRKLSFSVFRKLIFIVALLVFVFSAVQLGLLAKGYLGSRQEYKEISKIVTKTEKPAETPEERSIDFTSLKNLNNEAVAWISIPGLSIDYPIAHTSDNDKYLHQTLKGTYHTAGTIFIDYRNKGDLQDLNTFIYGHHMKDKSMFSKILDYQNVDVYKQNPYIYLYTANGVAKYRIFTAHLANALADDYTLQFPTQEDFAQYLNEMKGKSNYDTGVNVSPEDRIITLSTCTTYDLENEERYIVQARLESFIPKQ